MLSWLQGSKDVNALMARGNYAKAVKVIEQHLAEDPDSVHLRQLLADALARSGQGRRAIDVLDRLIDDFAAAGFTAKAVAVAKKIQRLDPRHSRTTEKLATLLKQHEAAAVVDARLAQKADEPEAPKPEPVPAGGATTIERPPTLTSEIVLSEFWFEEAAESRQDFHWSPLLSGLSKQELEAVIGGVQLLVKKPGSIVYSESEPGRSLFILANGWVRMYRRDTSFHNDQIGMLEEGQFFGEAAVLGETKRNETVIAASQCELLELDRPTFTTIAALHPRVRRLVEDLHTKRKAEGQVAQRPDLDETWRGLV